MNIFKRKIWESWFFWYKINNNDKFVFNTGDYLSIIEKISNTDKIVINWKNVLTIPLRNITNAYSELELLNLKTFTVWLFFKYNKENIENILRNKVAYDYINQYINNFKSQNKDVINELNTYFKNKIDKIKHLWLNISMENIEDYSPETLQKKINDLCSKIAFFNADISIESFYDVYKMFSTKNENKKKSFENYLTLLENKDNITKTNINTNHDISNKSIEHNITENELKENKSFTESISNKEDEIDLSFLDMYEEDYVNKDMINKDIISNDNTNKTEIDTIIWENSKNIPNSSNFDDILINSEFSIITEQDIELLNSLYSDLIKLNSFRKDTWIDYILKYNSTKDSSSYSTDNYSILWADSIENIGIESKNKSNIVEWTPNTNTEDKRTLEDILRDYILIPNNPISFLIPWTSTLDWLYKSFLINLWIDSSYIAKIVEWTNYPTESPEMLTIQIEKKLGKWNFNLFIYSIKELDVFNWYDNILRDLERNFNKINEFLDYRVVGAYMKIRNTIVEKYFLEITWKGKWFVRWIYFNIKEWKFIDIEKNVSLWGDIEIKMSKENIKELFNIIFEKINNEFIYIWKNNV